jgi:ferredoxin
LAGVATAVQRFPPPQFETDHRMPGTATPPPDTFWWEALDIGLLALALGIGAYLVLRRRSRTGVIALAVGALVYFGFYRGGCICPIGAIQNVALALGDPGYALPIVAGVFFLLPLLVTIAFGRIFCAGVCPLGAIQDVVVMRPVQVPRWLDHGLGLLAYLYLGAAVLFAATGSAFLICEYDPFVGLFRLSGTAIMLGLGGLFLLVGMFVARPYCRWFCPYGVVLSWIAPGAARQPKIDPVGCIQCQLCRDACPVNAIDPPTEPPSGATTRRHDRRRMALLVVALPLLLLGGVLLGQWLAEPFARLHERTALLERIEAEELGLVEGRTDASASFRDRGESREALEAEVRDVRAAFAWGTPLLGAFMALAVGGKLIRHARRPRRAEFTIDQSRCVACARCFALCPHHPGNEAMLAQLTAEGEPLAGSADAAEAARSGKEAAA